MVFGLLAIYLGIAILVFTFYAVLQKQWIGDAFWHAVMWPLLVLLMLRSICEELGD